MNIDLCIEYMEIILKRERLKKQRAAWYRRYMSVHSYRGCAKFRGRYRTCLSNAPLPPVDPCPYCKIQWAFIVRRKQLQSRSSAIMRQIRMEEK